MRADKGKKRNKYDSTLRRARMRSRELREALQRDRLGDSYEERRKEIRERRKIAKQDRQRSRNERHIAQRLKRLPHDRHCPACGKLRLKSREWVVLKIITICRSCFSILNRASEINLKR